MSNRQNGGRKIVDRQQELPKPKYVGRPPKPKPQKGRNGTFFIKRAAIPFEPKENGCPVRVLQGAEFQRWKQHYEARDAAERARAQA